MHSEPRLKIAIPKQEKIKKPVLTSLAEKGFITIDDDGETALLSGSKWSIPNIGVEFVRAADALLLLQEKVVDLAIIGSDVVDENTMGENPRFEKPNTKLNLSVAQCCFQLSVPSRDMGSIKTIRDLDGLRIATSYPKILQAWLDKNNIEQSKIIVREGGVESCTRLGLADAVADLVDTGRTLRKNNLTAIFDIVRTSAKIYAPPSAKYASQLLADEFLRYIRQPVYKEIPDPVLQVA